MFDCLVVMHPYFILESVVTASQSRASSGTGYVVGGYKLLTVTILNGIWRVACRMVDRGRSSNHNITHGVNRLFVGSCKSTFVHTCPSMGYSFFSNHKAIIGFCPGAGLDRIPTADNPHRSKLTTTGNLGHQAAIFQAYLSISGWFFLKSCDL